MENINVKISGHEVYKAVRNYLVNENQVTKEFIKEEVEKIISKQVEEVISKKLETNRFSTEIRKAIVDYMNTGIPPKYPTGPYRAFDNWLEEQVKIIIKEELLAKYSVDVNKKEDKENG